MKSPLYITGANTEGKFLIGGIFKMQDSYGFPVEMSFLECKEKNLAIDWFEALADCWLNDPMKYDDFVTESSRLCGHDLDKDFKAAGNKFLRENPEAMYEAFPVDAFCKSVLKQKRSQMQPV